MKIATRSSTLTAACLALIASTIVPANTVAADTNTPTATDAVGTNSPPVSTGLLPLPDYSGDLRHRAHLTGDWGGARTNLAEKGVQFDVDWTQYVQGIASGGLSRVTEYGGHVDYLMRLDLMRMGVLPGALVTVRAESRYGNSVNGSAGSILPVNTTAYFPLTSKIDEDVPIAITDFNLTQFLSEKFAVIIGKLDTLDGDLNEFASGRGKSQFMNANFIFNPALALRLPYSTLGAGILWLPAKNVSLKSVVVNTVDSSTTSGFNEFGNGVTWTTELGVQYRLHDLPGGMNVGGLYSFDQDFAQVNGELVFQPGQGLVVPKHNSTWAVYWSAWQYLFVADPDDKPIDLTDGRPDHQGVGLFARTGFADEDTNPLAWSASGGIAGRGLIPTRNNDVYGIGYYYSRIQQSLLTGFSSIRNQSQGMEAFYNFVLTPAAEFTLDIQVVTSPSGNVDTAVVLGGRLNLSF